MGMRGRRETPPWHRIKTIKQGKCNLLQGRLIMAFLKILVVDDEQSIAEIIKYNLEKEGFQVILAFNGVEAEEKALQEEPDLIILDIMLPYKDGLQVCKEIRSRGSAVPIIMLTAREAEVDRVVGLELGADDYVTKPFSAREVTARVKAILRRAAGGEMQEKKFIKQGELEINSELMEVYIKGKQVELTTKEFSLLYFLMNHSGQVFSREKLLDRVWGYQYAGEARTVDVTVRRVREKIEKDPGNPEYICTKRGVGYYFRRQP